MSASSEQSPIINARIDDDVASYQELGRVQLVEDTQQWMKSRTVLGIMGFLGFANVYAMRVNLSVAIVAMVNSTKANTELDVCPDTNPVNSTIPTRQGEFNWNEYEQGVILGSFFYGYVLTQVPGGRLAELFGGKLVYGIGVLLTALFTLLSPAAAYVSYPMFIAVRILEGIGEGVTYPAMHAMLAKWIPPLERSKFAAIVYAGSNIGTVISLPISGWLCTLEFAGGWPLCFYIFGGLGVIWFGFWLILVYDTPHSHPRIDPKEMEYISAAIGPHHNTTTSIPWMKFLTCLPLWAILITQCGQSWQFYTQLTELPSYMSNILHFDIEANATLSAVPYFTAWVAGILISSFADYLLEKNVITRINSIKLWNTIASVVPSLGLLGVAWVGCDKMAVLLLLTITGAFAGGIYAGNQMNHIDLSPQFAGTMFGITNAAANVCGFLAPYVIGLIINSQETLGQWRVVFYLAAAINLASNLFYLAFASAEEEEWSKNDGANINILDSVPEDDEYDDDDI